MTRIDREPVTDCGRMAESTRKERGRPTWLWSWEPTYDFVFRCEARLDP